MSNIATNVSAAVFGMAAGAVAQGMTRGNVAPDADGIQRKDMLTITGLGLPAGLGVAFLGMTTDTPWLYTAGSFMAGAALGGFAAAGVANLMG